MIGGHGSVVLFMTYRASACLDSWKDARRFFL